MPDIRQRKCAGFLVLILLVVLVVSTAFLIPSPTSHSGTQRNSRAQGESTIFLKELNSSVPNGEELSVKTQNSSAWSKEESYSRKQNSSAENEDAFYGSIENATFKGQTTGIVKADTNCKQVKNGLTNCIAIITTPDGTKLYFNYEHDMSRQPCLSEGNQVTITPLSNAIIKVVR